MLALLTGSPWQRLGPGGVLHHNMRALVQETCMDIDVFQFDSLRCIMHMSTWHFRSSRPTYCALSSRTQEQSPQILH